MTKSLNTPISQKGQTKAKCSRSQLLTIFEYLQKHIATASMVAEATYIPQKNICRIKRDLELGELLWEVEKKLCKKTGFKAWYLTTDPEKAPYASLLLNLWR